MLPEDRPREVYVFTEGEVTEPEFIEFVTEHGTRAQQGRKVSCTVENLSAPTKRRKPLPLVDEAIRKWTEVEKATLERFERGAAITRRGPRTAANRDHAPPSV